MKYELSANTVVFISCGCRLRFERKRFEKLDGRKIHYRRKIEKWKEKARGERKKGVVLLSVSINLKNQLYQDRKLKNVGAANINIKGKPGKVK